MRLRQIGFIVPVIFCFTILAGASSIPPAGSLLYPQEKCKVSFSKEENKYTLSYNVDDATYAYEIFTNLPAFRYGTLSVRFKADEQRSITPIFNSGLLVRDATITLLQPDDRKRPSPGDKIEHFMEKNRVHLMHTLDMGGKLIREELIYQIKGKTLIIEASATLSLNSSQNYAGFKFGQGRFSKKTGVFLLPTEPLPSVVSHDNLFISTYVDPFLSTTGKYENTAKTEGDNSFEASNTPAYVISDDQGKISEFHVTAYLTISKNFKDVLPLIPSQPKNVSNSTRNNVIIDLSENLLAEPQRTTERIIRRWEAPDSGLVRLNGTAALAGDGKAIFEVAYKQTQIDKTRILFSQTLDPLTKPETGIKGNFPVEKGDQLLFITYGPAVMTGGDTRLAVEIQHNDTIYDSVKDYSSTQGQKNWYYEWESGGNRSLMLWNSKQLRWDHPENRSYQTDTAMVCRMGQNGDAFAAAELFIRSLQKLGIHNVSYILRDWAGHSRVTMLPEAEKNDAVWGLSQTLQRIVQGIINNGDQIILPVKPDSGYKTLAELQTNLNQKIKSTKELIPFQTVLLDTSSVLNPENPLFLNPETGKEGERSSKAAWQRIDSFISSFKTQNGVALLVKGDSSVNRVDAFLASFVDGVFPPISEKSNSRNIIDEDLLIGRKNTTRIGAGSYNQYLENKSNQPVDPRLFPLDQYWATTVAYARVPYFSDLVWNAGITQRDLRKMIFEFTNLLQPVAKEYLDAANDVKQILYYGDDIQAATTELVLSQKKQDQATRVKIEYTNGLSLQVNRSSKLWNPNEKTVSEILLNSDGFMASNEKTQLVSIIGAQGNPFTASSVQGNLFLNSRSKKLITFRSIATDGMVKLSPSAIPGHQNITILDTCELRKNDLTPILLSNNRIDALIQWTNPKTIEVEILEAQAEPALLELYLFPQEWMQQKESIQVSLLQENGTMVKDVYWSPVQTKEWKGIRLPEIKTGTTLRISYIK